MTWTSTNWLLHALSTNEFDHKSNNVNWGITKRLDLHQNSVGINITEIKLKSKPKRSQNSKTTHHCCILLFMAAADPSFPDGLNEFGT